jgi:hypothetical protein
MQREARSIVMRSTQSMEEVRLDDAYSGSLALRACQKRPARAT